MGHTLMESRNGQIVKAAASLATDKAEREVAADLLSDLRGSIKRTVAADKKDDTAVFADDCGTMNITPHGARNDNSSGGSAIDGCTSRHTGHESSQRSSKRVEQLFGFGKSIGLVRKLMVRGLSKVNGVFMMTMIGWNLTRMRLLQGYSTCRPAMPCKRRNMARNSDQYLHLWWKITASNE